MSLFSRFSFSKLPKHKRFDYQPMYFDPDQEERQKRQSLKLEKGSFYRNSNNFLVGAFTDKEIVYRNQRNKTSQMVRMVILIAMLSLIFFYWLGQVSGVFTIVFLLIMMVVFVKNVNKY